MKKQNWFKSSFVLKKMNKQFLQTLHLKMNGGST